MNLSITIVSAANSWMNTHIPRLIEQMKGSGNQTGWIHDVNSLPHGDLAFYLSCEQIVSAKLRERNRHNLVVHASDLPRGRGWSPLSWKIVNGENSVPIVLFEAADQVDSGDIYLRDTIEYTGFELLGELREALAEASIRLCLSFIEQYPAIVHLASKQHGEATYYPKRTARDSRLDPDRTIREQFNLMRIADNEKYPCYFELGGCQYILSIVKKSGDPVKGEQK
ncbi:formyltransferase family protein [Paenibacillus sp. J2TS4]|uniref:formyltransferase family protein n=1 Tax=Paenibacillus sp. J2TS4 TaxID=2807194 RepID=UPI001B111920|nr:formyltransferase family protein [Paenibacillus sp. J2TS4]GIP36208.1 hypothetical protein J2TS4_54180 [Paenibacillus sp. J2TS4]